MSAAVEAVLSKKHQQLISDLQGRISNGTLSAPQAWQHVCKHLLRPDQPFELHQQLFAAIYSSWAEEQHGPAPVWIPDAQLVQQTNIARFMARFHGDMRWDANRTGDTATDWPLLHRASCDNPDVFWSAVLSQLQLQFSTPPTRILREHNPQQPDKARWLPDACLNIAACALNTPLCPGPDSPAIIWAPEGQPTRTQAVSWAELRARCSQAAAAIAARFPPGAPLAIALPLTVDAVVIYLSIILAGCVVVSIADSFAAHEVATRLRISGAVAIFTQDVVLRGGKALPLFGRLLEGGANLPAAIILQAQGSGAAGSSSSSSQPPPPQMRPGDVSWTAFLQTATPGALQQAHTRKQQQQQQSYSRPLPHIVDAAAPSTILFSSGTTGEPKAIPWSHTTPLRCAVDGWSLQDIQPGQVVCWPTNLGWMMGPWLVYASLLNGATMALYQGAPLGRDFGVFVEAARVNVLGLVPSIVKSWRSSGGCMDGLDWSRLRCFSSTGEASSPDDYHWLASRVQGYRPVIEYCGGTEIGGGFLSGCLWRPQAPSAFSTPSLGAQLVLLTDDNRQVRLPICCDDSSSSTTQQQQQTRRTITGELALVPPLLGSSQRLLLRDHTATYFDGMPLYQYGGAAGGGGSSSNSSASSASSSGDSGCGVPLRRHGDEVAALPGGYYRALGRCDDTMNLGGIKVSSVELERAVMQNVPAVLEAAAVGFPTSGGGPEQLHLFVVLAPAAGKGSNSGLPATPPQQEQQQQPPSDLLLSSPSELQQLQQACQAAIKQELNPLFKVHRVVPVASLPRTASNKVMRRLLKSQAAPAQSRL